MGEVSTTAPNLTKLKVINLLPPQLQQQPEKGFNSHSRSAGKSVSWGVLHVQVLGHTQREGQAQMGFGAENRAGVTCPS